MLTDIYVSQPGWLQRLDPRTKIALVLCGAVLFVVVNGLAWLLALLVAVHVLLLSSRVPAGLLASIWRQLLRVMVIVVVFWPLFSRAPGPVLFTVGPFTVTWTAVLMGLSVAVRMVGMSLLVFVLLATTRQNDLVRGLVRLGLPFNWGLTLAIALRYIPTFSHMVAQIQDAQAARGWRVDRGDLPGRFRGMIPVLVALIIGVLRTGDTLGMALAARGVGSGQPRTVWRDIHLHRRDWIALFLIFAATLVVLYARFGLGVGAEL